MSEQSSKQPKTQIDFSKFTMENGTVVNTTDRVCKGNQVTKRKLLLITFFYLFAKMSNLLRSRHPRMTSYGPKINQDIQILIF